MHLFDKKCHETIKYKSACDKNLWGKRYYQNQHFWFSLKWSYVLLDRFKNIPLGVGTFSTVGQPAARTLFVWWFFEDFLGFSELWLFYSGFQDILNFNYFRENSLVCGNSALKQHGGFWFKRTFEHFFGFLRTEIVLFSISS